MGTSRSGFFIYTLTGLGFLSFVSCTDLFHEKEKFSPNAKF